MDIGTDQGVSVIRGVCFYEKIEILAFGNFLYGSSDCYGRAVYSCNCQGCRGRTGYRKYRYRRAAWRCEG